MNIINPFKTSFPTLARMHHTITITDCERGGQDVTIDVRRIDKSRLHSEERRHRNGAYDIDATEHAGTLVLPAGQAIMLAEQIIETVCAGRRVFADEPIAHDLGLGQYAANDLDATREMIISTGLDLARQIAAQDERLDDHERHPATDYAHTIANRVNGHIGSLMSQLSRLHRAAAEYDLQRAVTKPAPEPEPAAPVKLPPAASKRAARARTD